MPLAWAWWRNFAARYVIALCAAPEGGEIAVVIRSAEDFEALIADLPPMPGAEYVTADRLTALWIEMDAALLQELAVAQVSLLDFLKSRNPA